MNRIFASVISIAVAGAAIPLAGSLTGCYKDDAAAPSKPATGAAPGASPIGVVDIAKVAKAMGWDADMNKNFQAADAEVKRQIEAHFQMVQAAIDQKKKEIETDAKLTPEQITAFNAAKDRSDLEKLGLTPKQIDDVAQLGNAVQAEKNQVNTQYQQFVQQRAAAINAAYRDALNPVVRRVASANERTVVIAPSDALIYSDPANDLTDKVIDDLQKSPPLKINLPELPKGPTSAPAATQP